MQGSFRVVDYVANGGGGVRFTSQLLNALFQLTDGRVELVSNGLALDAYRELFANEPRVTCVDVPPAQAWRNRVILRGIPGAGPLNFVMGTNSFHYDVPREVFSGCDQVWFPWLHRHRIPWEMAEHAVASLHDIIALDIRGILPVYARWDERETVRRWLASRARVIVSSNATVSRLVARFGISADRVAVVPLSGAHARPPPPAETGRWIFSNGPYLLAPLNVMPHKNHEVLLQGVGAWGARVPLVLTGGGTDLWAPTTHLRVLKLRRLAEASGMVRDRNLFALGYVDDPSYYALLDGAWALVMPTLAEGGGSFPVWEALVAGIPVICSDIPVMREMVERADGEVLWFDPRDPRDLADKLEHLRVNYAALKAGAMARIARIRRRSWADVARDYAAVMNTANVRERLPVT
jgi:glycosyltransferase involved in cell wall biosynthesis